jgi:hypothetical protein
MEDSSLDRDSEELDPQSGIKESVRTQSDKDKIVDFNLTKQKSMGDGTVDFNLTKTHFIGSGSA